MSIKCTFHQSGSESLNQEIDLQCLPNVGDNFYLNGDFQYTVKNIHHEVSTNPSSHKITIGCEQI